MCRIKYCDLILILGLLALAFTSSGCDGFFGKKTDPTFIDEPVFNGREVAYVPIQPVWDNFVEPVDIITGWDELIYIADGGAEEVVCLDQAGNEQGRFPVPGLRAIAQDRSLDLLCLGTSDSVDTSVEPPATYTLATIYRLELKNAIYGLTGATIENTIIHPRYYTTAFDKDKDPAAQFNGIAVLSDNSYYVTRSGPFGSSIFGEQDAVLSFNENDEWVNRVRVSTTLGIFDDYFKQPFSIASLAQPPQSSAVTQGGDFIITNLSSEMTLQVQYIEYIETEGGNSWELNILNIGDTAKAERFLYEPSRWAAPTDVAFTGDGTNYIFVVDGEKDSLYQFTSTGLEGIKPPNASNTTKNILSSFGGTGTGLTQFSNPQGVAYLDEIVLCCRCREWTGFEVQVDY